MAFSSEEQFGDAAPCHAFVAKNQRLAAEVGSQLAVDLTVADDITACQVVGLVVEIFAQHAGAGFAVGVVVLGKMAVDMDGVEVDAFAVECLQDEVVHGPERVFGKRRCAQSVLVAHHHQFEVGVLADERQVAEHSLGEA